MITTMHSYIYTFTLLLVLFFCIPQSTYAISYGIAPLVISEEVEARDIITKDITVTNASEQLLTVYPTVNNISVDAGGTMQEFIQRVESDATQSLAAWVEIKRSGIDIKPGESVKVPLTIRVHPEPKEGTYHALIGFGTGRTGDDAAAMVKSGDAPGTIVSVTVVDKKSNLLRLSRFLIDKFITGADNQAVTYIVNNPGETTIVPKGDVIFYNNRGIEVASMPVNPDADPIEPGGEMKFTSAAPTKGLLGKYKAYLSVEYGAGTQLASVQDTAYFYVIPLRTLLIIFGTLLAAAALTAFFVHRKYMNDDDPLDDADRLHVHVRDGHSVDAKDHDLHLTKRDS